MRTEIIEILQKAYPEYCLKHIDTANEILRLLNASKRNLVESILDDVKQSHSEYAVEKIENYLDDGCCHL